MKFKEAIKEAVSTGDVQGIQAPMNGKDKKKIVRRPIKIKKVKI